MKECVHLCVCLYKSEKEKNEERVSTNGDSRDKLRARMSCLFILLKKFEKYDEYEKKKM